MRLTPALALAITSVLLCSATLVGSAAAAGTARAESATRAGLLTGTWTGVLSGSARGSLRRERIVIVVNAHESGGSWRISATCRGSLTLDSVSGGYHHYRRRVVSGASCLGGDIDCLMRVGADVYDSVTPHPGGDALSGSLRRARSG